MTQNDTEWHRTTQNDTEWHRMISIFTNMCKKVQIDSYWFGPFGFLSQALKRQDAKIAKKLPVLIKNVYV